MCRIFGMVRPHWPLLVALGRKYQMQNRDAAGIAVLRSNGAVDVLKIPGKWDWLVEEPVFERIIKNQDVVAAICHVRHATTGNPWDNRNNHPVVAGKVAGCHHGVIYNHASFDVPRKAEVDSEVIFALLNEDCPLEGLQGWGAIAYFDTRHPGKTFLAVSNALKMRVQTFERSILFISGTEFGDPKENQFDLASDRIFSISSQGGFARAGVFALEAIPEPQARRLMGWGPRRKSKYAWKGARS